MTRVLALLFALCLAAPANAQRFVAVAFHGVVDSSAELGTDDILTQRLVEFFDWLRGNGWTPVSLDDIDAARRGAKQMPARAILLSFDDGYRSAYTRIYPLLLAYHYPAVFALVGAWMAPAESGTVRYGDVNVPRSYFLSWAQAREMAASGLAEFASHGYDLHQGVPGNPRGSLFPSTAAWAYDPQSGTWETDAAVRARVRADLERSKRLMREQLGRAPRTLVWPFGRYSGPAFAAARDAGFNFMLTLEPEPADASRPLAIPRFYPARDPKLGPLVEALRFADPSPVTRRVACLAAAPLGDEQALGTAIEDIRRLGANIVVLDPHVDRTTLSFVAWQLRSRAGVELFLRFDPRIDTLSTIADGVRAAPIDGVFLDHPGLLAAESALRVAPYPWTIRAARDAINPSGLDVDGRRALEAWRAAVALRPSLRLALPTSDQSSGEWPAPAADWLIMQPATNDLSTLSRTLAARRWLSSDVGQRLVLNVQLSDENAALQQMRAAQALGATSFGLCPTTLPADAALRATFSARTFPRLP